MMAKRKERSLEELYKLHGKLVKPRVTPILQGSCHMQGPVEELDLEIETDLEDNRGGKILIGSAAEKTNTSIDAGLECKHDMQSSIVENSNVTFCKASNEKRIGKESLDECNTTKQSIINSVEREDTLVSPNNRAQDNISKARPFITDKGDLAGISIEFDHKTEKVQSACMIEDIDKVSKGLDPSQSYHKGKPIGEETEENPVECLPSEELQRASRRCSLPCESLPDFILGSKDTSQIGDSDAKECYDNVDSKMQVDLNLEIPCRKDNGSEINGLGDTGEIKTPSKQDPSMLSYILPSIGDQRDQTESKSTEHSRENVFMSPDQAPGTDLGMQLPSIKHKERISEDHTKGESCNAQCEINNMELAENSVPEKVHDVTERFPNWAANIVDQNQACLEGVTSRVTKKANSSGIKNSSDAILSSNTSANSNVEITDDCTKPTLTETKSTTCMESMKPAVSSIPLEANATSSSLLTEAQDRYIIKENISQEMVSSSIVGTLYHFSVNAVMTTMETGPHLGRQQEECFAPRGLTDQIAFPSSKDLAIKRIQENIVSVTKSFSDVQIAKHSKDECIGINTVPGLLTTENLQPLPESIKAEKLLLVEVTPDISSALEQPSPKSTDERLFTEDSGNKMHLDEHSNIDAMDVEPSEMKVVSVVSNRVSEDSLHEDDIVEDDVKVCDICGDAGREEMLAVCSMCNDGAEHIYCMSVMLDKVPEGNWLCEGCKLTQNAISKKAETTQNLISKPISFSSKKQSSNDSSHSRPSAKIDKKRSDCEIKRIKGVSSSQASTKRRAEDLELGSPTKKQAVEVRNVQQVSSSNPKHVLSRNNSLKSADVGRMKQSDVGKLKTSVSAALSGNHLNSSLQNTGKPLNATGVQSPRVQIGMQSTKSRFTSVNSLTSDSSLSVASSNSASIAMSGLMDRAALSSKSADIKPSPSSSSRSSYGPKLITIPKNKKDHGEVGAQASIIRERTGTGGYNKVINESLSSKSKSSTTVSTITEPRMLSNVQNASLLQTKETKIGKPRKDEADSVTKKLSMKSGNTVNDSMSIGSVSLPLCSKPSLNDTSVSQATVRLGSFGKDICKSKLEFPDEKSTIVPCPVAPHTTKEECSSSMVSGLGSGVSEPILTAPLISKAATVDVRLEPVTSSGSLCYSESQTSTGHCNPDSISGQKLLQVAVTSGFLKDSKGCAVVTDKIVDISSQSPQNSISDEKPMNFASSWTRNFSSSAGNTRCYKCKELGHTAQFCFNRTSANTGNNSLRVSTLKLSAAKVSREMTWSNSGKWNNPLETIIPGSTVTCENDQASEQRFLSSDAQEEERRLESNLPGQHSANKVALFLKEHAGVCGKIDGESSMSTDFSLLYSDLGRNLSTATQDLASALSKDSVINYSSTTVTLGTELPSSMSSAKMRTKWNINAQQVYSSKKLYIDGEQPIVAPGDYWKFADATAFSQCTVPPTESTVTAVRRNTSADLPIISNGSYFATCMRVLPHGNYPQNETIKTSARPEHNFIWQGGFEVWSKGNHMNYYDGLQAHASTCAALKVLDAAKKFSSRIPMEEVPRLSTWPMQFLYSCPSDENVALYFFAKDLESYERSYKKLLEHMLKNDFALRANFDGVELLIFPSNQLPEKSQRWNKLLYLWGVFRERKANCIESFAYSQDRTHGQLSTSIFTAGNLNSKVVARVLPSPSVAGFSERADMDIDVEGRQEGSLAERGLNELGREKSQISPFSPLSSAPDEGKIKGCSVQNVADFVEQNLPSMHKNDEFLGEHKLSVEIHSSKLSSVLYSKASFLNNKEKPKSLGADDEKAVESQTFGQSVISQISSWRERAHTTCLGNIQPGTSAVSSSSLEKQDNSSDSLKIAHAISQSPGQQTNTEKERSKLKDDENDRERERAKELDYSSFRNKDLGHKEWKLREREIERERERNGEIGTERERDRRNSSRRHEEYSSHDARLRRDSREERRHHFSHSPTRHGSRSYIPSMRMNNYDHHHSRIRSPDVDQNRHMQPSSGAEACGASQRRDTMSPKGRSFNEFLADDKGQRKLKKSCSEIYVRGICKEQDPDCRNTSNKSSSELNICNQTQQVSDLSTSIQFTRSFTLDHVPHDNKEFNPPFSKESQVTERFFFPESIDAERDEKTTKCSEQLLIKPISKEKSSDANSEDQGIPSVEGIQKPPDLDVPNLELALGAKKSSSKPGVLPLFAHLLDRTAQQQPSSPRSEEGSSLSLSLTFPLPQKEQAVKSVLKENESLPDNGNVDTSLLLFGGSTDS